MALHDHPPHVVGVYTPAVADDTGGGDQITYALAQGGVACSINTSSAATTELYASSQIRVTHTVAFLSSALTSPLARGAKLVAADSGGSFKVEGIRAGRAYGGIPAFTYADCSEILN